MTPLAAKIAAEQGIAPEQLPAREAQGPRVRAEEVRRAAARPEAAPSAVTERPLAGMRKVIAERLAAIYQAAPHVPLRVEVDMSAAADFRRQVQPEAERRGGKLYLPGTAPSLAGREEDAARVEATVNAERFAPVEDKQLAALLEQEGRLVRVGDGFAVSRELYDTGRDALATLAPITLAAFRDALGVSRRVAQLLLERYDADGLTRRVGDERVLRRRGTLSA